jgi:septum site-determining protein MinC
LSLITSSANTEFQTNTMSVFQLKGGLFTLTSIQLLTHDLSRLSKELELKLQQAPKFFHNAPVVIDLIKIGYPNIEINFQQLKEILLSKHLVPVGIKGGTTDQQNLAIQHGFAILSDQSKESSNTTNSSNASNNRKEIQSQMAKSPSSEVSKQGNSSHHITADSNQELNEEVIRGSNTRVISEPVRSGQQIYVPNGDLLVLAPVSHGAELLADGHIHIYGPLRGRALAGVTGDTEARIFCQSLEAELISIAGQYKISEDLEGDYWQQPVVVHLTEGHLQIRAL